VYQAFRHENEGQQMSPTVDEPADAGVGESPTA
jgi:hypothetical protein